MKLLDMLLYQDGKSLCNHEMKQTDPPPSFFFTELFVYSYVERVSYQPSSSEVTVSHQSERKKLFKALCSFADVILISSRGL